MPFLMKSEKIDFVELYFLYSKKNFFEDFA